MCVTEMNSTTHKKKNLYFSNFRSPQLSMFHSPGLARSEIPIYNTVTHMAINFCHKLIPQCAWIFQFQMHANKNGSLLFQQSGTSLWWTFLSALRSGLPLGFHVLGSWKSCINEYTNNTKFISQHSTGQYKNRMGGARGFSKSVSLSVILKLWKD